MKPMIITAFMLIMASSLFAQTDSLPTYKRFPTVPPMKLLLTDSTTWFTKSDLPKKKPVMVMLFSPDCDHCKHETEEIIKNIDRFRNIQIVMSTTMPFEKMKEFYGHYDLGRFKNITVGRDTGFILPVFFNIRNLPFLAFYDKKGDLIGIAEGSLPVEKVLEKFQ
jgi:thiol-disulfide isomerase/thioredoxin